MSIFEICDNNHAWVNVFQWLTKNIQLHVAVLGRNKIFHIHEMNFERDCNPDQLSFIFAIFNDISQKHFTFPVIILKIIQTSLKIYCAVL